jgi:hypothetical protein
MADQTQLQFWDLWFPQAGSTGLSFARGRLGATNTLIVHAPPPSLTVEIRNENGQRLAFGRNLPKTADRPMAVLIRRGDQITREDRWPTQVEIGQSVILPGGEVGVLLKWWNAEDESEWRWQVEFYNHK